MDDEPSAQLAPGAAILPPADAVLLQRLAGNAATTARLKAGAAAVQRVDIYGRTAATVSALPAETARAFRRLIDAGDQAGALGVVVEAMTSRGQLDPRLLRTSGEGELWQIRDVAGFRAQATFRSSFADPDTPGRRLPNPRFTISSTALRADGLDDLYTSILHEYRHVEQEREHVNSTTPREQTFGYGADPDEFDAYLSEVEFSYRRRAHADRGAPGRRPLGVPLGDEPGSVPVALGGGAGEDPAGPRAARQRGGGHADSGRLPTAIARHGAERSRSLGASRRRPLSREHRSYDTASVNVPGSGRAGSRPCVRHV